MPKTKKKNVHAKKPAARKGKPARKTSAKGSTSKKTARVSSNAAKRSTKLSKAPAGQKSGAHNNTLNLLGKNHRERRLDPFTRKQKEKLLQLRDAMVDSMAGVAQATLRSRSEGSEASAFGVALGY